MQRSSRTLVAARAARLVAPCALWVLSMTAACHHDAPTEPPLEFTVTIEPLGVSSLYIGQTVRLNVTVTDAQKRRVVTEPVTWLRSNDNVRLDATPAAALGRSPSITALVPGSTVLTAMCGTGRATITVSVRPPGPVASIEVPTAITVIVDDAAQLTPLLRDADRVLLSGRTITYTSSDITVATVTPGGLVTAAAPGSAAIFVASEGVAATMVLTVNAYPRAFLWTAATGMTELGALPGFTRSMGTAINGAGQVVGSSWNVDAHTNVASSQGFRWSAGAGMASLARLPGGTMSEPAAINSAGTVVGWATTGSGSRHAVLWDVNGVVQDLGTLPLESSSQASAVDDNGRVVGSSGSRAFIWTAATGMTALTIPSPSHATGINKDGVVVGDLHGHDGASPFRWSTALGAQPLALLQANAVGYAIAINAGGEVVGTSGDACDYYCYYYGTPELPRVLLWSVAGMPADLGAPLAGGTPTAINAAGQVVGSVNGRAFLWSKNGNLRDLGIPAHHSASFARGINDAGQVVGGNQ